MNFKTIKVLVVDDARVARQIVKRMLTEIGFSQYAEADNGADALALVKKENIGLILSDWNMPKMTGIQFLKELRADPKGKSIPFIMVTAERMETNIVEAVQSGVSAYIKKPFGAKELEVKIRQALRLQ